MPTPKKNRNLCLVCGKETKRPVSIYCSTECSGLSRKATFEKSPNISHPAARRRLIEEIGNVCQICGIDKWMNKEVPLVMDHIDGNHKNNKRENLRLVCCNCDAQLDTYKNRNRGYGRHSRMMRYREGSSY